MIVPPAMTIVWRPRLCPCATRGWHTHLMRSIALLGVILGTAACGRSPEPPITVDFARLTQGETLMLRPGQHFALVGYAQESIALANDGIVEVVTPTVTTTELQTTLVAAATGSTTLTVTQNLCEGVATCSGPALFLQLKVHVQ